MKLKIKMKIIIIMILSRIVIEVIRTVYYYYYYYYQDILHTKNTQALFKYLNALKKHNKEHKQLSFR